MSILLMWGPHAFEAGLAAYEELRRTAGGRWRDHDIIGRRPAGQYLGPARESVSLRGVTYLDMGGAGGVLAMLDEARSGETYSMVSGVGEVFGVFRLERASVTESFHLPNGQAQKTAYDLEFVLDDGVEGSIWSLWP